VRSIVCKNERGKDGAKIFSHYTDIMIFVLGYFNLAHPVSIMRVCVHEWTSKNKWIRIAKY